MRTLVLNADYSGHQVVGAKSAMRLMYMNQADASKGAVPIEYYPGVYMIDTKGREHPIPLIVVLAKYRKKKKQIPFSKKNVFIRDGLTCQYCGHVGKKPQDMSLDHVIPRAEWKRSKRQGTPTNWTNIVTCCHPCNSRKADKSLKECGLKLARPPLVPANQGNFIIGLAPWSKKEPAWSNYLPPLYLAFNPDDSMDMDEVDDTIESSQ